MPRGVIPRQPSRSGRQDKVSNGPLRAKLKTNRVAPVRKRVLRLPHRYRKNRCAEEAATTKPRQLRATIRWRRSASTRS